MAITHHCKLPMEDFDHICKLDLYKLPLKAMRKCLTAKHFCGIVIYI